jgi:hypothetical protein
MVSFPIAKKVFKDLSREKTIVFTILLQLFIILASSIIINNSNVLFNPNLIVNSQIGIGIYPLETSLEQSSELTENFLGNLSLNHDLVLDRSSDKNLNYLINLFENDRDYIIYVKIYNNKSFALTDFSNEKIDGLIGFPDSSDMNKYYDLDLTIPKGDLKSSLVMTILKNKLELFEDYLRVNTINETDKNSYISLTKIVSSQKSSSTSSALYESLYEIILPFLLLLPGILLGGLLIDILFEDLETKTINLLMIITSFKKYLYEIILSVLLLSTIQVVIWELLLVLKGITIHNLPIISSMVILLNLILFLIAVSFVFLFNEKTKAQITYSFVIILLFVSSPISYLNPIRMIIRLAIGIEFVNIIPYFVLLIFLISLGIFGLSLYADKKEW